MSSLPPSLARRYPAGHALAGGQAVTLRLMTAADRDAVLEFAGALPDHDLLFLRRDITDPRQIDTWLADIAAGRMTTVLAWHDDRVAGYGTVDRVRQPWSAHVGEIRVLVAPPLRGAGLGRLLIDEAVVLAIALGMEKVVAQMTIDQAGARGLFSAIGFRPEAVLRDHVQDRHGDRHDLVVLSRALVDGERGSGVPG